MRRVSLTSFGCLTDIRRMPSPRLFGLRPVEKPTGPAEAPASEPAIESRPEPRRILRLLAVRMLRHRAIELPRSRAWGLSPAEKYLEDLEGQPELRHQRRPFILVPWVFEMGLSGIDRIL